MTDNKEGIVLISVESNIIDNHYKINQEQFTSLIKPLLARFTLGTCLDKHYFNAVIKITV